MTHLPMQFGLNFTDVGAFDPLSIYMCGKGKMYSVYSLVSTEMFTRPFSPSRRVHTETISIPGGYSRAVLVVLNSSVLYICRVFS